MSEPNPTGALQTWAQVESGDELDTADLDCVLELGCDLYLPPHELSGPEMAEFPLAILTQRAWHLRLPAGRVQTTKVSGLPRSKQRPPSSERECFSSPNTFNPIPGISCDWRRLKRSTRRCNRSNFDRVAGAGTGNPSTLSGQLFQGAEVAIEEVDGVVINQGESCSSMDTNSNAITGRVTQSWLVLCAAARAADHAFKGVSSCRRHDLSGLAERRHRSRAQSR